MAQISDTGQKRIPTQAESEADIKDKAQAALKFLRENDHMDLVELLGLAPHIKEENPE